MTLKGHYALCFKTRASFGAHHENLNEDRPILSATKMWPNDSRFWRHKVYADIRGGSQDLCKFSLDFIAPIYIIQIWHAVVVFKFSRLVYESKLPIGLPRVLKCVTSGDVGSGVAECDPQSIWNPRKNCGSFVDATSSQS